MNIFILGFNIIAGVTDCGFKSRRFSIDLYRNVGGNGKLTRPIKILPIYLEGK